MTMYTYNLHRKTVCALTFFDSGFRHEDCRPRHFTEKLYHLALLNITFLATTVIKERSVAQTKAHQDRITIHLNHEANSALYLAALQFDKKTASDLKVFPSFADGTTEFAADMVDICNSNKSGSWAVDRDHRLKAAILDISKGCRVGA